MIKNFFKNHFVAFIVAFGIGTISILPQLVFMFSAQDFSGIHMFGADAEHHYLTRIREVYDGHPALGNVFSPDKDMPYFQPPLGEIIVAGLGKILFMDAASVNVLSKFVFPFLIFLLIYFFAYKLFLCKKISLLASCAVLLGFNLTSGAGSIIALLSATSYTDDFLIYTRPINPQVSSLFLFACLYILFRVTNYNVKTNKGVILLYGALSGLSIYLYIYTWSFLVVLTALYFFYYAYKKHKANIKALCYACTLHILVTIPYWINFLKLKFHEDYIDTAARYGIIDSHSFIFGTWLAASLMILLFFWPRKHERSKIFFLFSIIALWILINQQIITGQTLQAGHYHWYITKPLVSILMAMLFVYILERFMKKRLTTIVLTAAVVILFYNAALVQINSYNYRYPGALESQRYSGIMSYLESNYASAQNIWATGTLAALLPVYTKHDSLNVHHAQFYLAGREYFIKKLFLEYKLRNIYPKDIQSIMQKERSMVASEAFGIYYREKYGDDDRIPDEALIAIAAKYKDFYELSYGEIFKDLDVDLVVWDKKKEITFMYEDIPVLKKIYEAANEFAVYKVENSI